MMLGAASAMTWYETFCFIGHTLHSLVINTIDMIYNDSYFSLKFQMQASAGNAENIRDDLNGLDKAVSAVLGLRTIERNQLLVSIAKSKYTKHRDGKNERITRPEELVRLYDLLIQVCLFSIVSLFRCSSHFYWTYVQKLM
jgi:hypothetical protein